MDSVQTTNTQATATGNAAATTGKKEELDPQERFLKLLVTQLQNQDPLNPLDNAEVTSQLAQISTVTGIEKLNDTLQILLSDIEDSRTIEAAALVGRNVLVPGTTMSLENGVANAGFELPQSVDELSVTILDGSGIAVRTIDLGEQTSGVKTFSWDGVTDSGTAAANGEYGFVVNAKILDGDKDVTTERLALGSVNSVSPGEHDAVLDMGKLGLVGFSDVKQIF
ncbi:MAG: flagellar hook assembly protein FlgD [Betaproteobacteria bacterium]|nr:flagellar hook assembly protein FlgD [Betaproteobacteria bacterium]